MSTTKLTLALSLSLGLAAIAAPVETTQHFWYSPEFAPEFNTKYEPEALWWTGNPSNRETSLTNQPAATSVFVMPYYAYVNYDHSAIKRSGHLFGAYGYYGVGPHAFEGEVDHFSLERKTISDLSQWDLSAAYANYVIPHW